MRNRIAWPKAKGLKAVWLVVDTGEWAGDIEDYWFPTRREAEEWVAKRVYDGFPCEVLGPFRSAARSKR